MTGGKIDRRFVLNALNHIADGDDSRASRVQKPKQQNEPKKRLLYTQSMRKLIGGVINYNNKNHPTNVPIDPSIDIEHPDDNFSSSRGDGYDSNNAAPYTNSQSLAKWSRDVYLDTHHADYATNIPVAPPASLMRGKEEVERQSVGGGSGDFEDDDYFSRAGAEIEQFGSADKMNRNNSGGGQQFVDELGNIITLEEDEDNVSNSGDLGTWESGCDERTSRRRRHKEKKKRKDKHGRRSRRENVSDDDGDGEN